MRFTVSCVVLLLLSLEVPYALSGALAGQTNQSAVGGPTNSKNQAGGPLDTWGAKTDKIILGTNLVSINITVTDSRDRFVTGLEKERFEVYDNSVKQEIEHFTDEDAPLSLGVVYDVSGSMQGRISRSLGALKQFLETSHEDDDFFLIGFNDRTNLLQDFTTSADKIIGRLMLVAPRGSTALYDAAYLAVEKIKQGRFPKKALLIISDGQDNNSRYTYTELRNLVRETGVLIYTIGITDPYTDPLSNYGQSVLEEMARTTGGRAFFPVANNDAELIEICTRIALELRHQYGIGFYPTDVVSPARWHKIKIKVNPPKGLGRLAVSYKDRYQSFKFAR
jgi:Ca-activated chloride channel homolog